MWPMQWSTNQLLVPLSLLNVYSTFKIVVPSNISTTHGLELYFSSPITKSLTIILPFLANAKLKSVLGKNIFHHVRYP